VSRPRHPDMPVWFSTPAEKLRSVMRDRSLMTRFERRPGSRCQLMLEAATTPAGAGFAELIRSKIYAASHDWRQRLGGDRRRYARAAPARFENVV